MYKIDCHSHLFEPFIVDGISKILQDNKVKEKQSYPVISNRKFLTAEEQLRLMNHDGIDISTIEYQIAYQHYDETKHPYNVRVLLSKFINDRLF